MGTRTGALSNILFSGSRRSILALLYGHADEQFYLREIARRAGTGIGANGGKGCEVHPRVRCVSEEEKVGSYDVGGGISNREVEEMIAIAKALQEDVQEWIRANHGELL